MKLIVIIFLTLCLCEEGFAQNPQWDWVNQIGSKINGESVEFVQTDTKGNVISLEMCLDSTEAVNHLYSLKIGKYNSSGDAIWKARIHGKNQIGTFIDRFKINPISLAVDSTDNIYVLAQINDTAFIGETQLNKIGTNLFKFSSTGAFLWYVNIPPISSPYFPNGMIAVDDSNNLIMYLDSKQAPILQINGTIYIKGDTNIFHLFLIKFDSAGNVLLAKDAIKSNDYTFGVHGIIAAHNAIVLCGGFGSATGGNITFPGNAMLETQTYNNMFLAKFDADGVYQWAIQDADIPTGAGLAVDEANSYYVLGYSQDVSNDFFLAKFDAGGTKHWVDDIQNISWYNSWSSIVNIAYSPYDHRLLLIGSSQYDSDGMNSGGSGALIPQFINCYDDSGDSLWSMVTNNSDTGISYSFICADRHANYYLSGAFGKLDYKVYTDSSKNQGTIGTSKFISHGGTDGFIAKLTNTSASVKPPQNSSGVNFLVYPNPASEKIEFIFQGEIPYDYSITITDILGREVLKRASLTLNEDIPIHLLSEGMYYATISTGKEKMSAVFIVTQ